MEIPDAYIVANQQRMAARRALEWIRMSKSKAWLVFVLAPECRDIETALYNRTYILVWFPDPSSGGEREGSGELPAACTELWHFNLMNLPFRT